MKIETAIQIILPALSGTGNKGLAPRCAPYITASVAAHLREANFSVRVLDAYLDDLSLDEIIRQLDASGPQIIGIPLAEVNREVPLESSLMLARRIKSGKKGYCIIGFGSRDIDLIKPHVGARGCMDYYIAGDPEQTMVELVSFLSAKKEGGVLKPQGLLYEEGGKVIFGGARILEDIDSLKFPAWDLVNIDRYQAVPHRYRNARFYPLASTRGCSWNKCEFCQDDACITKYPPYRVKSARRVVEEIMHANKKYGAREIQFYDQHFNTDKDWLLRLEAELKEKRVSVSWSCLARIDLVNPEVLKIMRRIGCWNILFGIESCKGHLLKTMNKGINPGQIEAAVGWCKEEGIEVTGSFLLGIPGETPEDVFDTVRFARAIGIDYAQFFIAKWTKEHEEFKSSGRLMGSWDFPDHDFSGRIFLPNGYRSLEHLKKVRQLAYLKFYLSPGIIIRHLKRVRSYQGFRRLIEALVLFPRLMVDNCSRKQRIVQ